MITGPCYRCGKPGHFAAECDENRPATSLAEHKARLAAYQQRFQNWLDGTGHVRWTPEQKASAITAENRMWDPAASKAAKG